ncbi:hypothetical protein B0H17DRAFT_1333353 [Mycena rosella]|uniref:Uncharacterized protein n=1 Tax=Mycena rosella TaxID=1033263 RepID=A0AAD7D7I0_MYCRO|nr:hypothetical protein B0H17DRAFT_1333353 [Mycena rosella]
MQLPDRSRWIQNSIIIAASNPTFATQLPPIPREGWTMALGTPTVRDPLETCGDAALHVALTELVMAQLKDIHDGDMIRKAILGPYDTSHPTPKFPGNAFEVFAGALALFVSFISLKDWVGVDFDPFIRAAVRACKEFNSAPPPDPSSRGDKRKSAGENDPGSKKQKGISRGVLLDASDYNTTVQLDLVEPVPAVEPTSTLSFPPLSPGTVELCPASTQYTFAYPEDVQGSTQNDTPPQWPQGERFTSGFDPLDWFFRA